MAVWFRPVTVEQLNERNANTLASFLGIQFTEIGDDTITAIMPVNDNIRQPLGVVHGGANVVLAESIASTAANMAIDFEQYYCVGLEINANHVRSVPDGLVKGVTRPLYLGKTTQVWHIELFNDSGKLTCVSRMTAAVLKRK